MGRKRKKITFCIDKNGCYVCTSHYVNGDGYPTCKRNGKNTNLHRAIYQEIHGPLADGIVVRHRCDNRRCIRFDHLEIGTVEDNVKDMVRRGRNVYFQGENHPLAKLTEDDVKEIRADTIHSNTWLANIFSVARGTIYKIKHRQRWKHV